MGNTKVDLVKDLEEALKKETNGVKIKRIMTIIRNAQHGMYYDFESELATPKMQLHIDLVSAGLSGYGSIDSKMQQGAYDDESASPEEAQRLLDLLTK